MIELSLQGMTNVVYLKPERICAVKAVELITIKDGGDIEIYLEGRIDPFVIKKVYIKSLKINGKKIDHKKLSLTTIAKKIAEAK